MAKQKSWSAVVTGVSCQSPRRSSWDELSTSSSSGQEVDMFVCTKSSSPEKPTHVVFSPTLTSSSTNSPRRSIDSSEEHECLTASIQALVTQLQEDLHRTEVARNKPYWSLASRKYPHLSHPVVQPTMNPSTTNRDLECSNSLVRWSNEISPPIRSFEWARKKNVFKHLQVIVNDWASELQRATDRNARSKHVCLMLGGSTELRVGDIHSDLDVVALCPSWISSTTFFSSLPNYLTSSASRSVSNLVVMENASIPLLTFHFRNISFDLLFARYPAPSVMTVARTLHNDDMLANMDAASIRSLSVPRVAELIQDLVPDRDLFRSCLRIVRTWAHCRGIYSNKAGYLGGMSWAILVAFGCQMIPNATTCLTILRNLFQVLSTWNWPTPILLCHPYENKKYEMKDGQASLQWCPEKNRADQSHLMPILTPGWPVANTATNVNLSTRNILLFEFGRAYRLLVNVETGSLAASVWTELFCCSKFALVYDHYLVINMNSESDFDLEKDAGFVLSRLRKLVEALEVTPNIHAVHLSAQLVKTNRVGHGFYFLGYAVDNSLPHKETAGSKEMSKSTATSIVESPVRYFLATELERATTTEVCISYSAWQELPRELFPFGMEAAKAQRARCLLSHLHDQHIASLGCEEWAKKNRYAQPLI